jgi:hypothetical protein
MRRVVRIVLTGIIVQGNVMGLERIVKKHGSQEGLCESTLTF